MIIILGGSYFYEKAKSYFVNGFCFCNGINWFYGCYGCRRFYRCTGECILCGCSNLCFGKWITCWYSFGTIFSRYDFKSWDVGNYSLAEWRISASRCVHIFWCKIRCLLYKRCWLGNWKRHCFRLWRKPFWTRWSGWTPAVCGNPLSLRCL